MKLRPFLPGRTSSLPAALCAAVLWCGLLSGTARAALTDAFHDAEGRLDDAVLDTQSGPLTPEQTAALPRLLDGLRPAVQDPASAVLLDLPTGVTPAALVGEARGRLQHVAALEMLRAQKDGRISEAREWRALVTLPRFASGEENALLLQNATPEQAKQANVTKALAREYIGWQVTRSRQLLDYLQLGIRRGDGNAAFLDTYGAEVRAVTRFPASLLAAAELSAAQRDSAAVPALAEPLDTPDNMEKVALWRQDVESLLPNLLTENDVSRLQRLLARFVKLIPQEYHNGVANGHVLIALEYREATQFTQQAQSLVNELGPVWQRDLPDVYKARHRELVEKFEGLRLAIAKYAPNEKVLAQAREIGGILEDDFKLSARSAGSKGDVIEETALEVRVALNNSLAAAKADQWQEAESQRLDAYTAFDSEIEPRVLPRDPELGRAVERSFIDGTDKEPGVKALLDRRAPMEELEAAYQTTLDGMDRSVSLLKTAVSPTTLGFTAFSIVAREGMEAVVVLAALLAGLRGAHQAGTRKGIAAGAWLALAATGLTFWLSQTILRSLAHYGEKLEAVVSILAVFILFIVTNWVFHKFYWVGWNAKIRSLSKAAQGVETRAWEKLALLGVGFLTVYREGFETALFLQSLLMDGNPAAAGVGIAAGALFIVAIGALTFRFGVKLPYRKLLVVTGVLVVSIMVSFLGSTVRLFQTVSWLPVHPVPGLHLPNWTGLWLGLYPSWEGLLIPPLALVYVGGAWLWTKWSAGRGQPGLPVPGVRPDEPARRPQEPAAV